MENEFRMLAKLIRLQCMFLSACVCAYQYMDVHEFVLIIRLHWPLRWHHSLWILNTQQIKILFKSLPRKLAPREREARTLDHYCLLFPQPCFLFSAMCECFLCVYNSISHFLSFNATPPPFVKVITRLKVAHDSNRRQRFLNFSHLQKQVWSNFSGALPVLCLSAHIVCADEEPDSSHTLMPLSVFITFEPGCWKTREEEGIEEEQAWNSPSLCAVGLSKMFKKQYSFKISEDIHHIIYAFPLKLNYWRIFWLEQYFPLTCF